MPSNHPKIKQCTGKLLCQITLESWLKLLGWNCYNLHNSAKTICPNRHLAEALRILSSRKSWNRVFGGALTSSHNFLDFLYSWTSGIFSRRTHEVLPTCNTGFCSATPLSIWRYMKYTETTLQTLPYSTEGPPSPLKCQCPQSHSNAIWMSLQFLEQGFRTQCLTVSTLCRSAPRGLIRGRRRSWSVTKNFKNRKRRQKFAVGVRIINCCLLRSRDAR